MPTTFLMQIENTTTIHIKSKRPQIDESILNKEIKAAIVTLLNLKNT